MIKVIIVDDHKVFSDGIISILNEEDDINVSSSASSAQELIQKLEREPVDVILMDITLGKESGLDITATVKTLYPEIKVLILSMHAERGYIVKAIKSGANGYLLKEIGRDEMVKAIRAVYLGGTYYSQQVSSIIINQFAVDSKSKSNGANDVQLTPREKEVLILITKEYTNQEIANELFISIRTVDTHRRNLLEKLQAKNTVGLVKYAMKSGLVDSE